MELTWDSICLCRSGSILSIRRHYNLAQSDDTLSWKRRSQEVNGDKYNKAANSQLCYFSP